MDLQAHFTENRFILIKYSGKLVSNCNQWAEPIKHLLQRDFTFSNYAVNYFGYESVY